MRGQKLIPPEEQDAEREAALEADPKLKAAVDEDNEEKHECAPRSRQGDPSALSLSGNREDVGAESEQRRDQVFRREETKAAESLRMGVRC